VKPRKHPADDGAVSEAQRAEWEMLRAAGRPLQPANQPPSRSKFGRVLDFSESLVNAGQGNRWR
jgi:hypothetical protein